jgi:hypothetical protein
MLFPPATSEYGFGYLSAVLGFGSAPSLTSNSVRRPEGIEPSRDAAVGRHVQPWGLDFLDRDSVVQGALDEQFDRPAPNYGDQLLRCRTRRKII